MPPYDHELEEVLNDRDRLRALRASNLLDSPHEKMFDDVTSSVCDYLKVPISLVTLIAPDRQFFKSSRGLPFDVTLNRETPIKDSACQYVVKEGSLVKIDNVEEDEFFRLHEGLHNIHAGAYLGTPLRLFGQAIGSVCAVDIKPRKWTNEEIDFLEDQASMLSTEVGRRG
ncbi:MAG: hypothetical protein DI586_09010 [Micavibrio aeruginosavorus]|uniref:GAF domain-containing protein n=1 Tax=Micavibrio aeruginosavorus TaxID=349221 RepID=A0A2W5FK13_9BACT|nr:MAG: hypothetical protein DI586_09010 [Micavibrio aeruginosavorus]